LDGVNDMPADKTSQWGLGQRRAGICTLLLRFYNENQVTGLGRFFNQM
jgi:hypothetical protein